MLHKIPVIFCLILCTASAQPLKLETIMKGPGFVGVSPDNIQWAVDNSSIWFDWNPDQEAGSSNYCYQLGKQTIQKMNSTSFQIVQVPTTNTHGKLLTSNYYFNENGNLVRYNTKTKLKTIVFSAKETVSTIFQFHDNQFIYFEAGNTIYAYNPLEGSIQQITHFTNEPPQKNRTKDTSFLFQQQRELFPFLTDQEIKRIFHEERTVHRKEPTTVYYEKVENVQSINVSATGRFITFSLHKDSEDPLTIFADFITEDGYLQQRYARPKVSDNDPEERMGIVDRQTDSVYFVSFSSLTDIRKKPSYLKEYGDQTAQYASDRKIAIHGSVMNENGKEALVDVRAYDNKDRWIVLINLSDGTINEIAHQHDEAWIGGPGISGWNDENGTLGWIDNTTCYFQSEETGYSHLYKYNCKTKQKMALTSGNWEVYEAFLSNNHQELYFIANKINPGVRNGYVCHLKDQRIEPLFEGNFGIEWCLSPDEKKWAIRYSTMTKPWELYLAPNVVGSKLKQITESRLPEFKSLKLQEPEIIAFPTSDQKTVFGRVYKPSNGNGAAVFFVHGAGYLQNAHYYWSYYQREMLFHQLLAEKGYVVIDLDYRASEGYGKEWRKDIYRHMGERDLKDYIDVKKYATTHFGIDSNRIGIYGGSYGGFITLMAMLKTPGEFACGAALRSVTDWAHYNHEYTSNILNYPGTDPIAYQRSSPIYFANGLQSPLLLLHGMVDDNVQFQDIIRLNQRFIELAKTNYQLAVFPTEAHGFTYTPAWVDEYRRIFDLFEKNLN